MQVIKLSLLLGAALAAPLNGHRALRGSAAYFLDNNPEGSSIISLHVDNGLLSDPFRTSTGGQGSIGTNTTGFPNAVDSLMSQGSVAVGGGFLFTVNAGSNTLAMLEIPSNDPWHPKLVGRPADTLGQFPMSVAYSEILGTACVLNGGAVAGVTCFRVDAHDGLQRQGGLRPISAAIHETNPPSGPPNSAAEIVFNPGSTAVFALIKGNAGATPPQPGYIYAWPVEDFHVSSKTVITQIADIRMEFGSVFLSESRLFVADPSYGVSILDIASDLTITEAAHTLVDGQIAICWSQFSPELNKAYGIDAGQGLIYEFSPTSGALIGSIPYTANGNNMTAGFDSAIQSQFMYTLEMTPGIAVFDLEKSEQIQYLDLTTLGSRQGWTGMAVYP